MYTQHLYTFRHKDNPTFYLTKLMANAICKTNPFVSLILITHASFIIFFFINIYIKKSIYKISNNKY